MLSVADISLTNIFVPTMSGQFIGQIYTVNSTVDGAMKEKHPFVHSLLVNKL